MTRTGGQRVLVEELRPSLLLLWALCGLITLARRLLTITEPIICRFGCESVAEYRESKELSDGQGKG